MSKLEAETEGSLFVRTSRAGSAWLDKYEFSRSSCLDQALFAAQHLTASFTMLLLNYSLVVLPALLSLSSASLGDKQTDPAAACASLGASLAIENVTVNFATYLPAGSNISLSQDYDLASCGYTSQAISNDLCRLAMYVATSNRSGITLEAWLPTNWTGRFLSTGNGGVSGCIQYPDLAYAAGLGFATVGKRGSSFQCPSTTDAFRRKQWTQWYQRPCEQ